MNPFLSKLMILLGIHLIVTTLDGLIALPNHCRLIYLGSTLLLVVVVVEELRRPLSLSLRNCAQALAPSLLLSIAVMVDCYVAVIHILQI